MSLNVQTGPSNEPLRIVVTGGPGVGKTTFAAGAPGVVFLLATVEGAGDLDIPRIPIGSWAALRAAVRQLSTEEHPYRTVVIDTVDAMERLCWEFLCAKDGVESISDVKKGFQNGFTFAVEEQQGLIADLDKLRAKGIAIIVLAHTMVKRYDDPEGSPYDRHQLAMNDKASKLWTNWADAVLFAALDVRIVEGTAKTEKDKGKARDVKPARLLWTEERAAYTAKNRQNLPESIPLDWKKFATAIRWDERHPRVPTNLGTEPAKPAKVDGLPTLDMLQDAAADAVKAGWKRADVVELFAPATKAADVPPNKRLTIITQLRNPPPNPNAEATGAK